PELKNSEDTNWLKEVNSLSLQYSIRNLDLAFTNFFKKRASFPKFKSKHDNHKSFTVPQNTIIDIKNKRISIPKFKEGIKAKLHRTIPKKAVIKSSTISVNPSGQFYISILTEETINIKKK